MLDNECTFLLFIKKVERYKNEITYNNTVSLCCN